MPCPNGGLCGGRDGGQSSDLWARDSAAVRSLHSTSETVLDKLAQLVGGELRSLGTLGTQLGVPLRGRGAILKRAAARGGIAAQLTRDRRR